MQQPQRPLRGCQHVSPSIGQAATVLERELLEFYVPVAELVPEEVVEGARDFVVAEVFDLFVGLGRHGVQAREDPAIGHGHFAGRLVRQRTVRGQSFRRPHVRARLFQAHPHEAQRVPDLVRKSAVSRDALFLEHHV